jgi:hypothetical protein
MDVHIQGLPRTFFDDMVTDIVKLWGNAWLNPIKSNNPTNICILVCKS